MKYNITHAWHVRLMKSKPPREWIRIRIVHNNFKVNSVGVAQLQYNCQYIIGTMSAFQAIEH